MKKIVVAIDGHSSCGKSTLAKDLANSLQYLYIDSGAMYRAVTYYFIKQNIAFDDGPAIANALKNIDIKFNINGNEHQTFLNGEPIEHEIRQMYISKKVSPVAAISSVRKHLVAQQQQMGLHKGIVMDGRDIGTVVFPDAELKIFLTASIKVRSRRRFEELLQNGTEVDMDAVTANLIERDQIDSNRTDSPLRKAGDAVVIDNSNLSREEQLEMVKVLAKLRIREYALG